MRLTTKHIGWLKLLFHTIALSPIIVLVLLVLSESAGGDPVEYIIHYTGMGALNSLVAVLLISPIAKRLKQGVLLQTRRLVGLYVFAYATLHVLAFISLDLLFEWSLLFQEVIKRPYIMVGALSLIILSLLAVTSINLIRRKMGQRWQQLHNFIYLIALLVPIHFYWSVKSEIIEPSIYIVLMIGLLYLRRSALKKIAKRLLPQSNKRNQSAEPQVKKA
jgi:sulfoxide reductase heme-binding subunit YedZ